MQYIIQKNRNRKESFDGAPPLDTATASSFGEAKRRMESFAQRGLFYAAIFIGSDGECVAETEDVK